MLHEKHKEDITAAQAACVSFNTGYQAIHYILSYTHSRLSQTQYTHDTDAETRMTHEHDHRWDDTEDTTI